MWVKDIGPEKNKTFCKQCTRFCHEGVCGMYDLYLKITCLMKSYSSHSLHSSFYKFWQYPVQVSPKSYTGSLSNSNLYIVDAVQLNDTRKTQKTGGDQCQPLVTASINKCSQLILIHITVNPSLLLLTVGWNVAHQNLWCQSWCFACSSWWKTILPWHHHLGHS